TMAHATIAALKLIASRLISGGGGPYIGRSSPCGVRAGTAPAADRVLERKRRCRRLLALHALVPLRTQNHIRWRSQLAVRAHCAEARTASRSPPEAPL